MPQRPIKVVPLRSVAAAAAPAAPPQLTYRNGPLLASVQVFTIFWGADWQQQQPLVDMANQLNSFFQFILTSTLMDQMAEYSVAAFPIGPGQLIGTTTLADATFGGGVGDADIQQMLQDQ